MNIRNRNLHGDVTPGHYGRPRSAIRWGLVMALTCALLLASMASSAGSGVPTASADSIEIVSVALNGGAPWTDPDNDGVSTDGDPVTVPPGAPIDIFIVENNGNWTSTEWSWASGISTDGACEIFPEPDFSSSDKTNPRTTAFTIPAPTVVGSYDSTILVHPNAKCGGPNVDVLTMIGAYDVSNAFDDPYSTDEDTVLIESAAGVLANDTDIDPGYTKIVTEVNGISADVGVQITLPSGALLKLNADGSFDYDPNGQFESLQVSDSTTDSFTYTILDSLGGSSSAMVTITIDGVNDPPTITSTAVTSATEDAPYSYDVEASDPDLGDTLSFSLDVFPSGMTIDPSSGLISWTPTNAQVGDQDVTARVEDAALAFDTQSFTVSVANVNDAPTTTSAPVTSATEDLPYSYDVDASDPDLGDTLSFSLDQAPTGMSIDPITGLVSWAPDNALVGGQDVTVRVEDAALAFDTQSFTVSVANVNDPPVAATIADQSSQDVATGIAVDASTSDVDGDALTYTATGLPAGLRIDSDTGLITWTINSHASQGGPANNGVYTVEVTANDGNDGATPYQFTWTVTAPPPPAVTTTTGSSSSSDDDDDDDDDVKPQDPDGDGYNNGVETQFGSDPGQRLLYAGGSGR